MSKKESKGAQKKQEKKVQEKIIEDRTFGLKNKNKSKQVQKYIQGVQHTVKNQGVSSEKIANQEFENKKQKKKEEEAQALMTSLFKTVASIKQDVQEGEEDKEVDPKTIVCAYYKQGLCQKGKKCKFSHDLSLEKNENINLYVDQRTQLFGAQNEEETMKDWDENKLQDVIRQKESQYKQQKPTEIVCKYFLDALEQGKYGWKWKCPNGMICIYKHCLPPGYSLKKNLIKENPDDKLAIEQIIDQQREQLSKATDDPQEQVKKVTFEVFKEWQKKRQERKEAERQKAKEEQVKKFKGKGHQGLSGRQLFVYQPELFMDDQEAISNEEYQNREEEEDQDEEKENQDSAQNNNEQEAIPENEQENEQEESKQQPAVDYKKPSNEQLDQMIRNDIQELTQQPQSQKDQQTEKVTEQNLSQPQTNQPTEEQKIIEKQEKNQVNQNQNKVEQPKVEEKNQVQGEPQQKNDNGQQDNQPKKQHKKKKSKEVEINEDLFKDEDI